MSKISRTFSIDHKIYEKFEDICKSKNINKSKVIQDSIKNFIGENYDVDFNTDYKLKFGDSVEVIKITRKENEFVLLSNGNKMNIFDFEMLYEEEDQGVKQVLRNLQSEKGVDLDSDDVIDPEILTNNTTFGNPENVKKMFEEVDVRRHKSPKAEERVIVRDLTEETESAIIKDDRTPEEKKKDLIDKWRKEETDRRKIKETFDIPIKPNDLNPTLDIKTTPNFPDLEPLESRGEMISIDRKTKKDIIKRKAQMKKEIQNFHTLEPNNIKETLEYIFNTNIDLVQVDLVSQNTGVVRKFFKIGIDKKYQGLTELKSILSNLGENNYDLIHIDEKSLQDKLKERIDKLNITSCSMVSNKPKHILDTLTDLLKGLINKDDMIGVDYSNPIYTIRIPRNIIENGEYLFYFISKCYNIDIDKLIMQPSEVVLEK